MKLAFLGLGVMGFPMAGHLQRAGHTVRVYNRSSEKAERWVSVYGGELTDTPMAAGDGAEIAFLCVGNDDDVRSVMVGENGLLSGLAAGATVVDHTTASAALARDMAEAASERGIAFLDAPVSGGQAGAENGALTIMVGGEPGDYEAVRPVLETYAKCVRHLGPGGSGQLAKMVNQVCIAGVLQGLAEGLLLAERAGLDAAAVVEVISQGAAQSWQMDNRFKTMLAGEYEHGFAVDWMRKDLGIVLEEAGRIGLDLDLTSLVDTYYADVQAMGGGRWDTSSLFARLRAKHDGAV
ncbi:MAG: NAD(P)-dependent oxidoreductase [Pseudomonadota bacterium]